MIDLQLTQYLDWRDYLQEFIDELQRRKAALPTELNIAQWTRLEFLRGIAECHHALSDVLRYVVDLNSSHYVPPDLNLDVDAVLDRCIDVHLQIDRVTTELLPLAGEKLPSAWAEL